MSIWIAVALAALALVLFWLALRASARRQPRLPPLAPAAPRFPIVLVHGFGGFERIGRADYFRGIRDVLERSGAAVFAPRLPAVAGVAARARALADAVREICDETGLARVNLIAHSMGGLDSRYAVAKLGLDDHVASLVTVGTPHWGTPIADAGEALGLSALAAVAKKLGIDLAGVSWMTANAAERFNREVADAEGVYYASVIGRAVDSRGAMRRFIEKRAGDNDGMVPVSSQRWGEIVAEVDADHWQQIGWSSGFDAAGLYAQLVGTLVERGY